MFPHQEVKLPEQRPLYAYSPCNCKETQEALAKCEGIIAEKETEIAILRLMVERWEKVNNDWSVICDKWKRLYETKPTCFFCKLFSKFL